jgi:NAD(P)-dependent dehydrogenase (short-subunit alcohol dehydrogenase family)
MEVII